MPDTPDQDDLTDVVSDILDDKPVDDVPAPTSYARESYAWAYDAYWAFEHMGARMTKKQAGTNARWAMYKHAKSDTHTFMNQILPKAMVLLEKARAKEGDSDEVQREERKSIDELRLLLRRAVKESENMV